MDEIKLRITSDVLDALDQPEQGEVLIYVDQDEEGLVVEIEAGPGLTVEVENCEKDGSD